MHLREISYPVSVAFTDRHAPESGFLLWSRYGGTFAWAPNNEPGTLPVRVDTSPWAGGAETYADARNLARQWFAPPADAPITDAGGYLPCSCHGSQGDHTCKAY